MPTSPDPNNEPPQPKVKVKASHKKHTTKQIKKSNGYCCWYCGNTNGHKEAFINNFHRYYICKCGASTQADGSGSNLPRIGRGRKTRPAPAMSVEDIIGRRVTADKPLTDAEERAYNTKMKARC